jgi:hypothetical protein
MHEWLLALKMMTGDAECRRPAPLPPVVVSTPAPQRRTLTHAERTQLRQAAERFAREATGRVQYDTAAGMYLPVRAIRLGQAR